jgi:hypothetical protein
MILVIDDVRIMDFQCSYARNVEQAMFALFDITHPFAYDEVWFDHDLGGDETIRPVVNKIHEAVYFGDDMAIIRKAIVHTSNPPGRDWIIAGLKECNIPVEVTNPPVIGHI